MTNQRATCGRGLFYTRDSSGKHEMTPAKYVEWAASEAAKKGVAFSGTPADIERMIREGLSHLGDLYLDYGVSGNKLSRPGLNAMIDEIERDMSVSHVFIPRRDRLARPDDALDGVQLENVFRRSGIHIVYVDREARPLPRGKRQDIGDLITSLVDFEKSGEDRRELAGKIIPASTNLGSQGFWTGGRAPYGFRRWLVEYDGTRVRQLEDKEHVRMSGLHVALFPFEPEIVVIKRVLKMLITMPASRVAEALNKEGVPSPDAGRSRTDNGVPHKVSGLWHATTITSIARNPLLLGKTVYGRRSMGDQMRYSAEGPRELEDSDFREDGQPKVIQNDPSTQTLGQAKFGPLVDVEEHKKLLELLDERATSQKGVPRSKDPAKNPLGGRIYDENCGWLMYRTPYKDSFRYKCGYYQQSHAQECDHNCIDGLTAVRFVLGIIRQQLFQPHLWPRFEKRIRELAQATNIPESSQVIEVKQQELSTIEQELATVEGNLALAKTDHQYEAVAKVFEKLKAQQSDLIDELRQLENESKADNNMEQEIEKALLTARLLPELVDAGNNDLLTAREAFAQVNAKLFLRFKKVAAGKRQLNKLAGGHVTFGSAPAPVKLYEGPTGRRKVKKGSTKKKDSAEPCGLNMSNPEELSSSNEEGKSLRNLSRGESILAI